jgi:hypothetical protein
MSKYINRKTILIKSILEKREQSASFIQNKFKTFIMKKDLIALAKKHRFYYSIYPSFLSEKNKNKKIKIKIYTDLSSPDNYTILPLRYCLLRNCHVFDIPKNKFPANKKIMNFNFLTNSNKVIIDPKYKVVLFGNDYVNQIDFKTFDRKETSKNNYIKLSLKNENSGSDSGESDCYSDKENENDDDSEKQKDMNENFNDDLNHNFIYLNKNGKLENSNTMSNSTKDSFISPKKKCKKKKRSKSILKNKNGRRNSIVKDPQIKRTITNKRVSFGSSQISFYRSQLFK